MNSFLKKNSVILCTLKEVGQIPHISTFYASFLKDRLHFYKTETSSSCLCLFVHIPEKDSPALNHFIFLEKHQIIIFSETKEELKRLKEHFVKISDMVSEKNPIEKMTPMEFFCVWLRSFLLEDLIFIHRTEKEISLLEEKILEETEENIHPKLLKFKQCTSRLYRCYNQMLEFTDELYLKKEQEFSEKERKRLEDYKKRLRHLMEETRWLREYLMEVQELYQTEIDIRQNRVMKTLTIIATIFFPLSLISGWYGMNFENMPELKNPHSYPVITGISIIIVILCLYCFKRKKYW